MPVGKAAARRSEVFGVVCVALANLCTGDSGDAISEGINAGHKLLAATFVYGASHSFDQIIYTGTC